MSGSVHTQARRPLVGLTTYREQARWGAWDQSADLLPASYARWVEAGGGVPVLLPPPADLGSGPAQAASVVARLDALVISGGADVAPARYAAEPHRQTTRWREDRDAWELALLDAATTVRGDLPVLGVCRGMQVMAVHAGGRLDQHVPDLVGHEQHSPGGDSFGATTVSTLAGSRIRDLLGEELTVNCHHHQSVASHPGFAPAARAADGTLEAMESVTGAPRFAVQWHPETDTDLRLIRALLDS